MRRAWPVVVGMALVLACGGPDYQPAAHPGVPAPDDDFRTFAPGTAADDLLPAVDEGLATPGHGARKFHFVVLRAGERHGAHFRNESFHAVIGGGVRYPAGTLIVRRLWAVPGSIDGNNEQPQRYGVAVAVEPGAPRPWGEAVRVAAASFCDALARRVPIHPDCVLAMGEIAYVNPHEADLDEKALAAAARARVPVPPADGRLRLRTGDREIAVDYERRHTTEGIEVGMMFRRGFDAPDRGMLFEYAHPTYRNFWMKNCRIALDLAYIHDGRVEQVLTMAPGFGLDQALLPRYDSRTVVKYALEMEAGWFERNGVKVGTLVVFP